MLAFSDLARAAYCPRQLYYARRESDRTLPPEVTERMDLAFQYRELRESSDAELRDTPIAVSPGAYRSALDSLAERADWDALADPPKRRVLVEGKDCRGIVHKLLPSEDEGRPVPSLVSPGEPPPTGVWELQRVRAVAAAKALAWEHEREVPSALVEYPTHGVVRKVRLTTQNRAAYQRTLREVRALDSPPPRLRDSSKCEPCEYRSECGVKTRSLRSLLGL